MQADSVQHLLVMIGKADVFQFDGVIRRQRFRLFRTLHLLAGKHLCHFTDNNFDLCNVIGVGKSSDQRLHNAERKHNDRQKGFCRQCSMHIEQAAHRQNPQQC